MLECAVAVADFRELLVDPRLFHGTLVARRLDGLPLALRVRALRVFCLKRPVNLFGGDHPRFDGRVAALDLDRVEEARGASDEGASWKGELRDGVEAALVERPRAVRNAPPARKVRRDRGVVLEPLELVVRAQMWVLVVEAHHHTHQDQVGFHVVEEGSAEGLVQGPVLQGPPQRVLHVAGLKALAGHLPHLLKAEPVRLLVTTLTQIELFHYFFGATTPRALPKQGLPRSDFDSSCELPVLGRPVLPHPRVTGRNAQHRGPVRTVQNLGGGESWVNLDA
mmetsp:Transcript_36823/g.82505  ORF Transcript_36823/g.82505 Transcript_36823/m.82505 type:complete len:280 (-) Transcript_36823:581-1420(-)